MPEIEDRLKRIEGKLDELGLAIISLARVEERLTMLFRRMDQYDGTQKEIEARTKSLELNSRVNGQTLRFAERAFWMFVPPSLMFFLGRFWER